MKYREYEIDFDAEDRYGNPVIVIRSPNGDEWHAETEDPEEEIDKILDEQETMQETYERNEEWRRRIWELI